MIEWAPHKYRNCVIDNMVVDESKPLVELKKKLKVRQKYNGKRFKYAERQPKKIISMEKNVQNGKTLDNDEILEELVEICVAHKILIFMNRILQFFK